MSEGVQRRYNDVDGIFGVKLDIVIASTTALESRYNDVNTLYVITRNLGRLGQPWDNVGKS